MHDRLFANQRAMTRQDILAHAGALGLDMARFTADLDGPRLQAMLDRDLAEGRQGRRRRHARRSSSTAPPLVGAQPLEAFAAVIDKALAAKTAAR